jgi:hypothetical protein
MDTTAESPSSCWHGTNPRTPEMTAPRSSLVSLEREALDVLRVFIVGSDLASQAVRHDVMKPGETANPPGCAGLGGIVR